MTLAAVLAAITACADPGLAVDARVPDVQVLDRDGQGSAEDLAAGLRRAHAAGADLVLTSLALGRDAPDVRASVSALRGNGVLLVAAAGNGFGDPPALPADYPEVLGVAALDASGRRRQLSGWPPPTSRRRVKRARPGAGRRLRGDVGHLGRSRGGGRAAGSLRWH